MQLKGRRDFWKHATKWNKRILETERREDTPRNLFFLGVSSPCLQDILRLFVLVAYFQESLLPIFRILSFLVVAYFQEYPLPKSLFSPPSAFCPSRRPSCMFSEVSSPCRQDSRRPVFSSITCLAVSFSSPICRILFTLVVAYSEESLLPRVPLFLFPCF